MTIYGTLYVMNCILKTVVVVFFGDLRYVVVGDVLIGIFATTIPGRQARHERSIAEHIVSTKRDFMSYMSHEIRTPLNTVYMGVQLLAKECAGSTFNSDVMGIIKDIDSSCQVAISILNEFLMANKIESGNLTLDFDVVEVTELLSSATVPFNVQARQKGVRYSCNGDTNIDPVFLTKSIYMEVDIRKISQVIRNLISNALKFTPAGGRVDVYAFLTPKHKQRRNNGSFSVHPFISQEDAMIGFPQHGEVDITTAELSNYYLRVEVHDSGVGISKENQEKLFKGVVQFNAAQLQNGGGSGLGLWISKNIVDMHGGTIGVTSNPGTGSVFYFQLDCFKQFSSANDGRTSTANFDVYKFKEFEDSSNLERKSQSSASEPKPTRFGNVLIVDDSAVNRKMVSRMLSSRSTQISQAENGRDALLIVRESMEGNISHFNVIIMDAMMPEMGGPEATRRIRDLGYTGVIVFLTGNVRPEERAEYLHAGADDVVRKPCTLDGLEEAINMASRKRVESTRTVTSYGSTNISRRDFPETAEVSVV
eukprot:CAMPEP_0185043538 /NCGR_PEP_ID=MMETSP1103-20130426/42955_1 /TAXON_ID=36769 /ORGANISM="Paraphysomonas bandaiensis, Strain Caron Lab Isolate" /LENGTH=535 /DNA_ID=CAMNT_0027583717 /DNA_START=776 /DNA_END=2383 /DNA_ORIENTATION=+